MHQASSFSMLLYTGPYVDLQYGESPTRILTPEDLNRPTQTQKYLQTKEMEMQQTKYKRNDIDNGDNGHRFGHVVT